jgi:hypothetical protein
LGSRRLANGGLDEASGCFLVHRQGTCGLVSDNIGGINQSSNV